MAIRKRKLVFVALSGGVDSSVAAALLKNCGFDVVGIFMKNWTGPSCRAKEDFESAAEAAEKIGIPIYSWNFEKEYKSLVFEYTLSEYLSGRTPNPDVLCNKEIKFGIFFKRALELGADFVATGHYARIRPKAINSRSEIRKLLAGIDVNKDQSYFLWTLTQQNLARTIFPIGEYTKQQVRKIANEIGLPNANRPDSQGLCFVGKVEWRDFLKEYLPPKKGVVVTTSGKILGEHEGIQYYTIGQRKGLGFGGGVPYYVAEKDARTNTLKVAISRNDPALYRYELMASNINWISGKSPKFPLRCYARIRYRQQLQSCTVNIDSSSGFLHVLFDKPQWAVAAGQSIVFYIKDEVLGGGVIL